MSEENKKNINNGQYDGEQLYWYLAQDGRYYDQYGRPWMGDQQQYQNDEGYNGWSYSQEYNQSNFEENGSLEQSQEQTYENTGYNYDSSNAEWKQDSNGLENRTYCQEYVQNNVQENTQYVQNYEQNNQQLNQPNQPNQPNELQEYPYDSQQSLQQEYQQDYLQDYPQSYQQGYSQEHSNQGYGQEFYQQYDQQYNQEYTQGYGKTDDGAYDGTQTYEKETDSLEQTYSYQNEYQTGNQNENSYGNIYPEQNGWPQNQDGYNYSDNNGENYVENCYQNVQEYQKDSDVPEQTYTYEQPLYQNEYQEGYQDVCQMNQPYGEQYIGNSEETIQNTEEFVSSQETSLQDEQTDEQDTQTYRENRLTSEAGPSYQEYKKAQEQLNNSKVDYTKNKKKSNKVLAKVGLVVLAGALAGGGFGIYNNFFRDKSEVRVCESTTSYNKGIGFTFYIGDDGQTITAIEKNDKVSLDFIKKNVTEENAKQILEEYKKNVKNTYEENVEKYKNLDFFSSDIKVKSDSISTKYRFDVSSKKFKYKKYEAMMNDFGLNYYYNEDLGKFVYNEEQFLSASTPLGGIDNVKCNKVDIKVVKQDTKEK